MNVRTFERSNLRTPLVSRDAPRVRHEPVPGAARAVPPPGARGAAPAGVGPPALLAEAVPGPHRPPGGPRADGRDALRRLLLLPARPGGAGAVAPAQARPVPPNPRLPGGAVLAKADGAGQVAGDPAEGRLLRRGHAGLRDHPYPCPLGQP